MAAKRTTRSARGKARPAAPPRKDVATSSASSKPRPRRGMVRIGGQREPVQPADPQAWQARLAERAPKATRAAEELSRKLLAMLGQTQKEAPAPLGMVKCPLCGTPIEPTRNQRIRAHVNVLEGGRCPASQQRWELFGGAPAPSPRAKPAPARSKAAKRAKGKARKGRGPRA